MNDTAEIILHALLLTFIGAVAICLVRCSKVQDKNDWNNGYCECGGHWRYEQAVGHAYRTSYIYRCDECGKTIEVWEVKGKTNEK